MFSEFEPDTEIEADRFSHSRMGAQLTDVVRQPAFTGSSLGLSMNKIITS